MEPQDVRTLSPDALFDLRSRLVAAVRRGLSQVDAATVFAVHRSAVNRWCRKAAAADLRPRRRGRPPGPLPADQEAQLLVAIRTRFPNGLGLAEPLWTRDAVAAYAATRFGAQRSRYVWGRWLRRLGLAPRFLPRGIGSFHSISRKKWRLRDLPQIMSAARGEGAAVYWLDVARVWIAPPARPGTGPDVRPPATPLTVVRAWTGVGGLRFAAATSPLTPVLLVGFLRRLLRSAAGPVVEILDDRPAHRHPVVRRWAAARADRLRLEYRPR
jgi:transposase